MCWTLLFCVALIDTLRHRQVKRIRGYQLQRGIVVTLFAYVVQDVLLLSYSILSKGSNTRAADDVRKSYYVFSDLADSIFMVGLSSLLVKVEGITLAICTNLCCCRACCYL